MDAALFLTAALYAYHSHPTHGLPAALFIIAVGGWYIMWGIRGMDRGE